VQTDLKVVGANPQNHQDVLATKPKKKKKKKTLNIAQRVTNDANPMIRSQVK